MDFYWVGFIFWLLIGASVLLFIWGLWKKSWKVLLISGIALILPSLYFLGAENWFRILVFLPLIPLFLAYYSRKRAL
ncbi:hypothetical protein D1953_20455 [Peribacillus asahii]|uniref:Uncharacterized protein n=1 Tax=Peribacillus asahii TaxID=228899 RepID=A0A398AVB3_9BACI|nr:hypothetical protein [Peribacillus asahii]RID81562.1 hypothetical protein D1953_20455 [Peribacillus asahii]